MASAAPRYSKCLVSSLWRIAARTQRLSHGWNVQGRCGTLKFERFVFQGSCCSMMSTTAEAPDCKLASTMENPWSVSFRNNQIEILNSQGECAQFDPFWLAMHDPTYIHPTSGQRTRSISSCYEESIQAAQVVTTSSHDPSIPPPGSFHPVGSVYHWERHLDHDRFLLQITWQSGRVSHYDLAWLWEHRYEHSPQSALAITKEQAIQRTTTLFTMDYAALWNEENLYHTLRAIFRDGAVLIHNTPPPTPDNWPVAQVALRLAGSVSHAHLYGPVFDVRSEARAHNIAYTNRALPPHQDLAYYQSPPGLQLLHCIANSASGGQSILIDALAAATEFRARAPHLFDVLTSTTVPFVKQREGAEMVAYKPHIQWDVTTETVVAVTWAPPFMGPTHHLCNRHDLMRAQTAFETMLDSSLRHTRALEGVVDAETAQALRGHAQEYTWEYALQPGQMLVFNNLRMLHGRREFKVEANQDGRHLMGCYTNIDETLSCYRLQRRKRLLAGKEVDSVVRNAGNGTCGSR
jgi:gamma-butyrobetaine dioxygenase